MCLVNTWTPQNIQPKKGLSGTPKKQTSPVLLKMVSVGYRSGVFNIMLIAIGVFSRLPSANFRKKWALIEWAHKPLRHQQGTH